MKDTIYSSVIEGSKWNYYQYTRFDFTDGYIGISQWGEADNPEELSRVLLTPIQMDELILFIKRNKKAAKMTEAKLLLKKRRGKWNQKPLKLKKKEKRLD